MPIHDTPDSALSRQWLLPVFAGLMVALVLAQTAWSVVQDRQLTLAAEKSNGLVAVRLLEELAGQLLRDADRKLETVSKALETLPADADGATLTRWVIGRQELSDNRFLKSLQFVDLQGKSWVAPRDYPAHEVDVSDQSHIQYLLRHPEFEGTVVGQPFQSRYDSQWVIPVARNLFVGGRQHLGIISTDILVPYLSEVFGRVASESRATVALVSTEGFVIVRSPFEARYVGRDLRASPRLAQVRDGAVESAFDDGSLLDDERPRFYTTRKVAGFPLVTAYGRDHDSIYADWQGRTRDRLMLAAGMVVLIVALSVALHRNLWRLRRSEQRLRRSEAKFVNFFQKSPLPLVVTQGRVFLEVNEAFEQQSGYQREELLGHKAQDLGLWVHAEQRLAYLALLDARQTVVDFEVEMLRKDGQHRICRLSSTMLGQEPGSEVIVSIIDVTLAREMEREILELNASLERRVQSRTLKLEEANQELAQALASVKRMQSEVIRSEKMAALGSLVAGVAHEMNTPIGNSVTTASALDAVVREFVAEVRQVGLRKSALEEFQRKLVDGSSLLQRNLQRAAELIASFKQVAVDQSSDQRRPFKLNQTLQDLAITLRPMYQKTPYALVLQLASDCRLDSYPGALGQVVTNLVSNAVVHAFEGRLQGQMTLSTTAASDGEVTLVFADDGVGIPWEAQARVFDPFFTTKLGQGGSGLGMHLVYNLVTEVLGGRISLESEPGRGTAVHLVLPLVAPVRR